MPRIFGLRNRLQEVQDSIFLRDQDEQPLKGEHHHEGHHHHHEGRAKHLWTLPEPGLDSFELEIIQIPGKNFCYLTIPNMLCKVFLLNWHGFRHQNNQRLLHDFSKNCVSKVEFSWVFWTNLHRCLVLNLSLLC